VENKPLAIDIHNEYVMEHHVWLIHIMIYELLLEEVYLNSIKSF
jgi:hypothetical protein